VNLPKFLAPDLPLFKGIMSDLFPTIAKPNVDHGDLAHGARARAPRSAACSPCPTSSLKCVQLYEMVVVRHGMMMVGPTGGGKTQMLRVTQAALTLLTRPHGPKINKTCRSRTSTPRRSRWASCTAVRRQHARVDGRHPGRRRARVRQVDDARTSSG
jgi:hypothetical protein